jgi:hypothetical protein
VRTDESVRVNRFWIRVGIIEDDWYFAGQVVQSPIYHLLDLIELK